MVDAALADDATGVDLVITIDPGFATLVRANTRFYNVSGITADWGLFKGLDIRTDSLESVVSGGIAFATPDKPGEMVESGRRFELADEPEDSWLKWQPRIPLGSG
ncbi:MAG: hypothetical protein IPJ41_13330 [Phycisphaerales bacterium]|nr:hypothetical protein [Phycisphaerales bacterium]